jgi:hypothetical protein
VSIRVNNGGYVYGRQPQHMAFAGPFDSHSRPGFQISGKQSEEKDRRGRSEIDGNSGFHGPLPANIAFGSELY